MHISAYFERIMKFVKLVTLFRLAVYFVLFVRCEFVNAKVTFTNEPCKVKDESVFLPVPGNVGQYKQCGPAGYYWIFPCSPDASFSEEQKACVRSRADADNKTSPEMRPLTPNKKALIKANKNFTTKHNSPKSGKHGQAMRRQEITDQPWSPDYYEGDEEFVESSEQPTITTTAFSSEISKIPPLSEGTTTVTLDHKTLESKQTNALDENRQKANLKENTDSEISLLKSKNNINTPSVTGMPDPDTDLAQPDDSAESPPYYKYNVSTIRRTPASYQKAENLMMGATTKSQEVFESQSGHGPSAEAAHYWQGYEQRSQDGNQQSSQQHVGNAGVQKMSASKQPPANRPLSQGAQELAKVISDEDLETLSRVFQVLAGQQGGAGPPPPGGGPVMLPPGLLPGGGQPSGGPSPMLPPSGFVPPLPEAGGQPYNMLPPASVQNQMAQYYMIPPQFVQKSGTTEAPRLFKLVPSCVENGTCSHEDNAETYCLHESDPVSYYQCSPGVDYGIWVVRQCPAGLHFNSDGECGKRQNMGAPPPSTATRVQIQPPDIAPSNAGGGNVNIQPLSSQHAIWGQQPGDYNQPEMPPHYATLPPAPPPPSILNPYPPDFAVQTVTPESAYVSSNNAYPETSVGAETVGGLPSQALPNNLFYVKQPQIWEQPKILPSAPMVPNQQESRGFLYPGIQQTSQQQQFPQSPYQPPRQIVGPRVQQGLIRPVPSIQPVRPPGYPSPPKPPVDQQSYQLAQTPVFVEPSIPKGQPPILPKQPVRPSNVRPVVASVVQPIKKENLAQIVQPPLATKSASAEIVKTFSPKQVSIGEQFIQSPHVPIEFETAIPTLIPNINRPPVASPSINAKLNQLNLIQQASQVYGGYPRYPEIPQLKSLSETSWSGRTAEVGGGVGQSMPSAGGHPYQPQPLQTTVGQQLQPSPSRPSAPLPATQTVIRPKANQNSQILIGNNQIRNNPLKMMQSRKNVPIIKNDAVAMQRDSPLTLDKGQRIQQAADLLFSSLVHQKLKVIESLTQHLSDRRISANSGVRNFTAFNKRISDMQQNSQSGKNADRNQQQQNYLQRTLFGSRNSLPQTNIIDYLNFRNRIYHGQNINNNMVVANRQAASEKSLPYGLNYFLNGGGGGGASKSVTNKNNNNLNFFPIKSTSLQPHGLPPLLLSKSVQKTQERDNANFSVPFWPIDDKSNYQPFVGQKCRLSATKILKPVKFNTKTFLVCQSNKKFNKDVNIGTWTLSSCPDNEIFDRLNKRCVKKLF